MLLVQRGKELGYKLSDEQFKSVVDNIKKENKIETDEQFQAALKQENMTMADLRRQSRAPDDRAARAAERGDRQDRRHRGRGAQVLRRAPAASSRRRRRSRCARFSSTVPADGRGVNVGAGRGGEGEGRADSRAARSAGEQLREAGGGGLRRAVEGQRRPDRSAQPERSVARPAQAHRGDEGRRRQPGRSARSAGYQILKLESLHADRRRMPFDQAREQISDRVFTDKRKDEFEKYLDKLRAQAIIEWKNPDVKKAYEEGLAQQAKPRRPDASPVSRRSIDVADPVADRDVAVVRGLDAVAARAGRARAARAEADRRVPADHHPLEPLEGSQEEDRLAAVSRLLLRALRSRRRAADPEVHRRRQHRVVRGQAGADSRIRARQHPACWSAASCSTIPAR